LQRVVEGLTSAHDLHANFLPDPQPIGCGSRSFCPNFRQLLSAVRAKDPDRAGEMMRRHIGAFRHRIAEQFLSKETTRNMEGGEQPDPDFSDQP